MSTLAQLLAAGTARFNAQRRLGQVALDHSTTTLSGLFFARADLSKLDLSNAELEDCTVSDADFREADLRGAFIHGGRYERCDFTGVTGLDAVELDEVTGLGTTATEAPALEEEPRFTSGHVAVNEALERELDAHPDDEKRWLVYADWLQAEGSSWKGLSPRCSARCWRRAGRSWSASSCGISAARSSSSRSCTCSPPCR